MNDYTSYNDAKGRDARMRVDANRAERAKARDFDGTLFMSKSELRRRLFNARIGLVPPLVYGVRS